MFWPFYMYNQYLIKQNYPKRMYYLNKITSICQNISDLAPDFNIGAKIWTDLVSCFGQIWCHGLDRFVVVTCSPHLGYEGGVVLVQ